MFSWLGDILAGLGDALSLTFEGTGAEIVASIWDALIDWMYITIFDAASQLFLAMNNMGVEIFSLNWVKAVTDFFGLFGWALFAAGVVIAVFDIAIECQTGRVSVKTAAINVLKGFFACSLVSVLPIELYKFCISLQLTFSGDLIRIFTGSSSMSIGELAESVLTVTFTPAMTNQSAITTLVFLIAFSYCIIKVFFANIKRGGILLIQVAVGSLYMFSVPRGFTDGFNQWCRQVVAICLTAFMQTTLLYLGMLTFQNQMLLGLGIMLAADEVPRIAQQFGLDSSVKVNMSSVIYTTTSAVNLVRAVAK